MWRMLRWRPIHMAIVSGVTVYVLLTLIGMVMHENEHETTDARRRYLAIANQVRRDDRGILAVNDDTKGIHPEDALVAAPQDNANFIYIGKQEHNEMSGDKLDQIAKLLENIGNKIDEKDNEQNVKDDFKNVENIVKQLMSGKGESEKDKDKVKDLLVLEEPDVKEAIKAVEMDDLPFLKESSYQASQCPKTVQTIAKYSKWFRDRYVHGMKLFTDFEDIRNYKNYHKLEHYSLPFGYKRAKRTQLGTMMSHPNFTNAPLYADGKRPQCLRCAVVGCGGILNGSNAGPEIDSHDLVFRLNRALSSGRFAQDVGTKTSFYTFFPESMHAQDVVDENSLFVYTVFKQYDLDYMESIINNKPPPIYTQRGKRYKLKKPPVPPDKLKLLHPDFFRYVFTRYLDGKSHRPTTGALVVLLAVHICDEVTIYGFGYDQRFTLHYYDKSFVSHTDKSTALHDVDNERELWNKLHEEGVIRFFKRDL